MASSSWRLKREPLNIEAALSHVIILIQVNVEAYEQSLVSQGRLRTLVPSDQDEGRTKRRPRNVYVVT